MARRGTPAQFRLEVRAFLERVRGNALFVFQKLQLDLFSGVVLMSPVGNPALWKNPAPPGYVGGRFRNNWYATSGQPSGESSNSIDATGRGSLSRIEAQAAQSSLGETIYLVNNLPYAWPLETGWSSQAPAGMVGITVERFRPAVMRAAEEARRR